MKPKIAMLSLGCARNLVDAEAVLGKLKQAGFFVSAEIEGADALIINTCCFIREAQEESIDIILKACRLKKEGRLGRVAVMGCLVQGFAQELVKEFPEVDAFLGAGSYRKIVPAVKSMLSGRRYQGRISRPGFLYSHLTPRFFLTPRHFTYLKISEGCNHYCSFCIIPRLRGRHRSRAVFSVVKEARALFKDRGVSEINIIGQDTTLYGKDRYGKKELPRLLRLLAAEARGRWLRLLYAHPAHFSRRLIDTISAEKSICKYIDLPIQHINDKILRRMNRSTTRRQILSLIARLRSRIAPLALRTTLIVGFPGETDKQFAQLLDFIRDVGFERLGLFKYSREQGTRAYNFRPQVPEKVKQARWQEALKLQQKISGEINRGFLGRRLSLLVEEDNGGGRYTARTEFDAPEVDGCVYLKSSKKLRPGNFVPAKITDTLEYDLVGEVSR